MTESLEVPEQVQIRMDKRAELVERGMQAYPVSVPIDATIAELRAQYGNLEAEASTGKIVGIAGRVIFSRNTGKLCFATLSAGSGETIQAMVSLAEVGEESLADWKSLVDLGDYVFVHGEVITSKRGELSVMVDSWQMAAKALRPLPVAHKDMGEESRVRQRYVDLIMRPQAQEMARLRVKAVAALRNSLAQRDYLEIETPMLQTQPGGAT
ncbi:MAG: OB-fold nucleic acid binding domain-containing protein, partial [Candidatus Nanopelagicales bacterium]